MALGYTYTMAEAVDDFVRRLPFDEQRRLATACRDLAGNPFRTGNYTTIDETGRTLQNLRIDDWVFTYWPDHGAKELRITEIVQV